MTGVEMDLISHSGHLASLIFCCSFFGLSVDQSDGCAVNTGSLSWQVCFIFQISHIWSVSGLEHLHKQWLTFFCMSNVHLREEITNRYYVIPTHLIYRVKRSYLCFVFILVFFRCFFSWRCQFFFNLWVFISL